MAVGAEPIKFSSIVSRPSRDRNRNENTRQDLYDSCCTRPPRFAADYAIIIIVLYYGTTRLNVRRVQRVKPTDPRARI